MAEHHAYRTLDAAGTARLLAGVPHLAELLGGCDSGWTVEPLTGGNLNQVFLVRGPDAAFCAKQSLPYMRLLGPDAHMPRDRIAFEHRALSAHGRHAPERVPTVRHFDPDLCLLVMDYMSPHVPLRQGLMDGRRYPVLAAHLGDYLARVIFHTSDLGLTAAARREQAAAMAANHGMYKFMEDLAYTEPYVVHPRNAWNAPHLDGIAAAFRADRDLKLAVSALKHRYMTAAETFNHGDLHTDSVLVTDGDTRIIDMELAMYGPMGYDFGHLFGHLFLNAFAHDGLPDPEGWRGAQQQWVAAMVPAIWKAFETGFRGLWGTSRTGDAWPAGWFGDDAAGDAAALDRVLGTIRQDAVRYAGIEMIRRILGVGQVPDLQSIEDPARRAVCETRALNFAREMVVGGTGCADVADMVAAAAHLHGPVG